MSLSITEVLHAALPQGAMSVLMSPFHLETFLSKFDIMANTVDLSLTAVSKVASSNLCHIGQSLKKNPKKIVHTTEIHIHLLHCKRFMDKVTVYESA